MSFSFSYLYSQNCFSICIFYSIKWFQAKARKKKPSYKTGASLRCFLNPLILRETRIVCWFCHVLPAAFMQITLKRIFEIFSVRNVTFNSGLYFLYNLLSRIIWYADGWFSSQLYCFFFLTQYIYISSVFSLQHRYKN